MPFLVEKDGTYFTLVDTGDVAKLLEWIKDKFGASPRPVRYGENDPPEPALFADKTSAPRGIILDILQRHGIGAFWVDEKDSAWWTGRDFSPYPVRVPEEDRTPGPYEPVAFAMAGVQGLLSGSGPAADISEYGFAALLALHYGPFEELLRETRFDSRLSRYIDRLVFFRGALARPLGALRQPSCTLRLTQAGAPDDWVRTSAEISPGSWIVVYTGAARRGMAAAIAQNEKCELVAVFGEQPACYRVECPFVDHVARLMHPVGGPLWVKGFVGEVWFDVYIEAVKS
jgi:hypothetical protein